MPLITPCLWFNYNAEEAIDYYKTIFPDLKIKSSSRYGEGGPVPAGTLLVAVIEIDGKDYMLLNGGPGFPFTEAVSFAVKAETQEDIDYYWNKFTSEGGAESMCGWCRDKFGLSWQIFPPLLTRMLSDKDKMKSGRVMQAMMKMKKIDIPTLQNAYDTD